MPGDASERFCSLKAGKSIMQIRANLFVFIIIIISFALFIFPAGKTIRNYTPEEKDVTHFGIVSVNR